MKKMLYVISVLALMLFMVGSLNAQSAVFNKANLVLDKSSVISSTVNDTTAFLNLVTGEEGPGPRVGTYDVHWFFRSADSVQCHLYYRLKNADANWTGAWTKIDSCIHVDDAGAATDTTSRGVAAEQLTPTLLYGATSIQFYIDYNAGTVGTSASALGDGAANRFRFYVYLKPMSRE